MTTDDKLYALMTIILLYLEGRITKEQLITEMEFYRDK